MSLLEDIKNHYKNANYPPEGSDLDFQFVDGEWVEQGTQTVLVSQEDNDDLRWGTHFTNVYQRHDELVAVDDVRPATEMQDWGDYGEPEIYPVRSETKTITVTTYRKVDS